MGLPVAEDRNGQNGDEARSATAGRTPGADETIQLRYRCQGSPHRLTLSPCWDLTDRKTMTRSASHVIRETESLYRDLSDVLSPGGVVLGSILGQRAKAPPGRQHRGVDARQSDESTGLRARSTGTHKRRQLHAGRRT